MADKKIITEIELICSDCGKPMTAAVTRYGYLEIDGCDCHKPPEFKEPLLLTIRDLNTALCEQMSDASRQCVEEAKRRTELVLVMASNA